MKLALHLILFFRKSPWVEVLVFLCSFLLASWRYIGPFEKYELVKDGLLVKGTITERIPDPLGKEIIVYNFTTKDGEKIDSWTKSLTPEIFKIDNKLSTNNVEVVYVPSKPELHWLNFNHGYTKANFWDKYLKENSLDALFYFIPITIMVYIGRFNRSRRNKKPFIDINLISKSVLYLKNEVN